MTPHQLMTIVAQALRIDGAMVVGHMRGLREEGMVTKAGRGRAAARMSSRDAGMLLLSLCAGLPTMHSSAAAGGLAALRYRPQPWAMGADLELATADGSLIAGIAALLDHLGSLNGFGPDEAAGPRGVSASLCLFRPVAGARLFLEVGAQRFDAAYGIEADALVTMRRYRGYVDAHDLSAPLATITEVATLPLWTIARHLSGS